MDAWLAWLEASGPAQYLRFSRLPYAAVNGLHIFGIALLVGSTVPLGLRMLGVWKDIPAAVFRRVLSPVAAAGLAIAMTAGFFLFSVRAGEYAALGVFQVKMVLVLAGLAAAAIAHAADIFRADASRRKMAFHGIVSLTAWAGALVCGRLIAFSGE